MNNRFLSLSLLLAGFFIRFSTAYSQQPIMAMPVLDSISNTARSAFAERLSLTVATLRDTAVEQTLHASVARNNAQLKLTAAKADTTIAKEALKVFSTQVKNAQKAEQAAQKRQKMAEKTVLFATTVVAADSAVQQKDLPKLYKQYQQLAADLAPPSADKNETAASAQPAPKKTSKTAKKTTDAQPEATGSQSDVSAAESDTTRHKPGKRGIKLKKSTASSDSTSADTSAAAVAKTQKMRKEKRETTVVATPQFKSYDPATDVLLHPPHPPCALAVNVRDEFSGEVRRETPLVELFRYTAPALRTYMEGKPYVVGQASLGSIGVNTLLSLTFVVNDRNARKAFGNLPKNGSATLKFLDGTTFIVNNLRSDDGTPDASGQVYTYRSQYALESALLKKMAKTGLDKIRVSWATGYEDYDVQNVDLLLRLTDCLK